jgi:hypothetical protein
MATPAQILANRENALHSTGPLTSEGKSRSAQNATKHGLTSKAVVLPNESEEEYNEFRDSLVADLEPVGDREITLATVIAETYWRRQRFYRLETAFMTARMKAISEANPEITDGDEALIQMFTDPAEMTRSRLLLRYLAAAERAHKSAVAEFEKVQKARRKAELEQVWIDSLPNANEVEPESVLSGSSVVMPPIPGIRYVSHKGFVIPVPEDHPLVQTAAVDQELQSAA